MEIDKLKKDKIKLEEEIKDILQEFSKSHDYCNIVIESSFEQTFFGDSKSPIYTEIEVSSKITY